MIESGTDGERDCGSALTDGRDCRQYNKDILHFSVFSVNSEIRYQKAITVGGRSDSSYLQNHVKIYPWTTTH